MKCHVCKYVNAEEDWPKLSKNLLTMVDGFHEVAEETIPVYACPKCGTVKVAHWLIEKAGDMPNED